MPRRTDTGYLGRIQECTSGAKTVLARWYYSNKLTERRHPVSCRGSRHESRACWTPFSELGLGWESAAGQDGLQPG